MGRRLQDGLLAALTAIALQWGLAHLLAAVPPGTRAQATGVAVATLAMLVGGWLLGLRARYGRRPRRTSGPHWSCGPSATR